VANAARYQGVRA